MAFWAHRLHAAIKLGAEPPLGDTPISRIVITKEQRREEGDSVLLNKLLAHVRVVRHFLDTQRVVRLQAGQHLAGMVAEGTVMHGEQAYADGGLVQ